MTLTSAPSTDVICAFGRDVSVPENDQENVFDTGQEGSSQQSRILQPLLPSPSLEQSKTVSLTLCL